MPWKDDQQRRDWQRQRMREKRQVRLDTGLCSECGVPETLRSLCPKCRKNHRRWRRQSRQPGCVRVAPDELMQGG